MEGLLETVLPVSTLSCKYLWDWSTPISIDCNEGYKNGISNAPKWIQKETDQKYTCVDSNTFRENNKDKNIKDIMIHSLSI